MFPTVKVVDDFFSSGSFEKIYDIVVRQCRMLTSYYDEDFHRTAVHDHPVLTSIHKQITPYASQIFGEELKPSYVFVSNYLNGGICPLHIDRPQCYRTIDVMVHQDSEDPWELCVAEPWTDEQLMNYNGSTFFPIDTDLSQFSDSWERVVLEPNQAACYSGTHSWHVRPKVSVGRSDLIFFHFVSESFVGDVR